MNHLLTGILAALVATNQPAALSNLVKQTTGLSVKIPDPNDPVEKEYQKLLQDDDDGQEEAGKWIREAEAFAGKGADTPYNTLQLRIRERLGKIGKAYEEFLQRHPKHARARLAYGSFLQETGEEEKGVEQMEKSRELDPTNPAAWNNLANYYGHRGPPKKSFGYYEKAIELNPNEAVYYWNFAVTVYLFRQDVREYYHLTESEVFDKALDLYRQALKHDPKNFELATDYAQSFYGTNPARLEDGFKAWEDTLKIARDEVEREGVYVHFARIQLMQGKFDEARKNLNSITNEMYAGLKGTLTRKLEKKEAEAKTNAVPARVELEKKSEPAKADK